MKNKIQVLKDNSDIKNSPVGTRFRTDKMDDFRVRYDGEDCWKSENDLRSTIKYIEVDFDNIEPEYVKKGMDLVGRELEKSGQIILYSDEEDILCTQNKGPQAPRPFYYWRNISELTDYELKPLLPETIMICPDCLKEECECGPELIDGDYYLINTPMTKNIIAILKGDFFYWDQKSIERPSLRAEGAKILKHLKIENDNVIVENL